MTIVVALALLLAGPALADERKPNAPANPLVDALAKCLDIADDPARLACTDRTARALVDAARNRDVVVVDRDQVKKTRRSLFGLNLDAGDTLTGPATPAERIETLDTTVVRVANEGNGRWVLTLAEGGRWRTAEPWTNGADVRTGDAVTIQRALLGSYLLRGKGLRSVKVMRVN